METSRVEGIVPIEDWFDFMHRVGFLNRHDYQEYYTFPGGHLEDGESLEEGTIREIKEEFGINVKIVKKLYETYSERFNRKEYFFLCEYVDGKFGTGDGPEFSNDIDYANCGKYIPEIVKRDEIEKILLLPINIRNRFIEDLKKFEL